jgi:hypothetical protein
LGVESEPKQPTRKRKKSLTKKTIKKSGSFNPIPITYNHETGPDLNCSKNLLRPSDKTQPAAGARVQFARRPAANPRKTIKKWRAKTILWVAHGLQQDYPNTNEAYFQGQWKQWNDRFCGTNKSTSIAYATDHIEL